MKKIILYSDEFDIDTWETYCEILNIPKYSLSAELIIKNVIATTQDEYADNKEE